MLFTVGLNQLRIERVETNWPYPRNIIHLDTGDITILFPHNRSFVRLKPAADSAAGTTGFPVMPSPPGGLPAGIGPQPPPGNAPTVAPDLPPHTAIGPTNLPGMPPPPMMPQMPAMPVGVGPQNSPRTSTMPATRQIPQMPPGVGPQPGMAGGMPAMPMMPPMPMERPELKATTDTTNLLGYTCTRYELKQRGEVMEIWATDKLMPFQPYLQNQPHRFGPRMIEEQWGELLKAKKVFPLLAVLRFDRPTTPDGGGSPAPGPERLRFDIKSITPGKITDETLFQPPSDYHEIQPLPF
ncbi:MAG TPA: DUF4412 domain-containing protein [Candidatus Acidoferrum sp.]|nr:DUF4412 domain-containing protein [Candidatus Acidoferrum sp.]